MQVIYWGSMPAGMRKKQKWAKEEVHLRCGHSKASAFTAEIWSWDKEVGPLNPKSTRRWMWPVPGRVLTLAEPAFVVQEHIQEMNCAEC